MGICSVLSCGTRGEALPKGVSMHTFPRDPYFIEQWTVAIGRKDWKPGKSARICSLHFVSSQYNDQSRSTKRPRLLNDAIPLCLAQGREHHFLGAEVEILPSSSESDPPSPTGQRDLDLVPFCNSPPDPGDAGQNRRWFSMPAKTEPCDDVLKSLEDPLWLSPAEEWTRAPTESGAEVAKPLDINRLPSVPDLPAKDLPVQPPESLPQEQSGKPLKKQQLNLPGSSQVQSGPGAGAGAPFITFKDPLSLGLNRDWSSSGTKLKIPPAPAQDPICAAGTDGRIPFISCPEASTSRSFQDSFGTEATSSSFFQDGGAGKQVNPIPPDHIYSLPERSFLKQNFLALKSQIAALNSQIESANKETKKVQRKLAKQRKATSRYQWKFRRVRTLLQERKAKEREAAKKRREESAQKKAPRKKGSQAKEKK